MSCQIINTLHWVYTSEDISKTELKATYSINLSRFSLDLFLFQGSNPKLLC